MARRTQIEKEKGSVAERKKLIFYLCGHHVHSRHGYGEASIPEIKIVVGIVESCLADSPSVHLIPAPGSSEDG